MFDADLAIEIPDAPPKLVSELKRTRRLAFDLETKAPEGMRDTEAKNPRIAIPTLYSITCGEYKGVFRAGPAAERITRALFECPWLRIGIHNTLYDVIVLHSQGIVPEHTIRAQIIDIMVFQFLLDEEQEKGLKEMAKAHLRVSMKTYKEVTQENSLVIAIDELTAEVVEWNKKIKRFPKERPWPGFDGLRTRNKTATKNDIKAVKDARWPGTPSPTSGRAIYTPEERAEREQFQEKNDLLLDLHFGPLAHEAFEEWVTVTHLIPLQDRIDALRLELEKQFLQYAQDDTAYDYKLWTKLEPIVRNGSKVNPPLGYWLDVEMAVREITTRASCRGLPIDVPRLQRLGTILDPLIEEFKAEIKNLSAGFVPPSGEEFNPASTIQLRTLLFDVLNVTPPEFRRSPDGRVLPKFTPGGQKTIEELEKKGVFPDLRFPDSLTPEVRACLACDSEVLERIDHPIGMAILNMRVVEKLKGTYVEGAVARVLANGRGRMCGIFNSIGTDTGRHSSSDPNLQNIPSRKKPENYDERVLGLGPTIREAFIAEEGYDLIVADQSQVELRLIADDTCDPTMLSIYREGVEVDGVFHYTGDIHARTATQLNIPRKSAKGVNFGFLYGMYPTRFARQQRLFIPGTKSYDIERATDWRNRYFETYSYIQAAQEDYTQKWFDGVTNYLMVSGRLRHFPKDGNVAGGKILNAKIQGSSADIIKLNMAIIDRYVCPIVPSLELLFQVHDELGYQALKSESALAAMLVKFVMEFAWFAWLKVPILASAKICRNWAAKDDDDVPEVGVYYACIDEQHRTFTADTWSEYRAMEKSRAKITAKGATAMLSRAQFAECLRLLDPEKIKAEMRIPATPIK